MLLRRLLAIVTLCGATIATPLAQTPSDPLGGGQRWIIDGARSEARFTITKLGFEDVTGLFRDSDGEITYDQSDPESGRVQWRVLVASVQTNASNRDKTLQSPEYFDAGRHPYLAFVSTAVRRVDQRHLEVQGALTMRGVSQPLSTIVEIGGDAASPRFETSFEVNRYDFGIVGGSILGRLIGRIARIHLIAVVHPKGGIR